MVQMGKSYIDLYYRTPLFSFILYTRCSRSLLQLLTPFPVLQLASYQCVRTRLCLPGPQRARLISAELLVGE